MFFVLNATKYESAPFKLEMHTIAKLIWGTDPRTASSAWTAIQIANCHSGTVPLSDLLLAFCEVSHWIPRLKSLLGPHNPVTEMDMAIHMSAFDDLVKKCFSWICSTGRSHLIFSELLSLGWGVVHIDYMIQYLISRLCLSFHANRTYHIIDVLWDSNLTIHQLWVVCETVNIEFCLAVCCDQGITNISKQLS